MGDFEMASTGDMYDVIKRRQRVKREVFQASSPSRNSSKPSRSTIHKRRNPKILTQARKKIVSEFILNTYPKQSLLINYQNVSKDNFPWVNEIIQVLNKNPQKQEFIWSDIVHWFEANPSFFKEAEAMARMRCDDMMQQQTGKKSIAVNDTPGNPASFTHFVYEAVAGPSSTPLSTQHEGANMMLPPPSAGSRQSLATTSRLFVESMGLSMVDYDENYDDGFPPIPTSIPRRGRHG